ncbi:uncharacterized protein LOC133778679 [Humulus lupulus]|uniref:uncharacterized protein LOC133778679 n=1 Tax=Humulus lupulus TaxID=3486 RepID=UPI002B41779C|nr:uncharacterized protein LOC133778679 [Humulus lupulus]
MGNVVHYRKPAPMFKGGNNSRDTNNKCAYHKDVGHMTERVSSAEEQDREPDQTRASPPLGQAANRGSETASSSQTTYGSRTVPPRVDGHVATISGGPHLGGPSWNDQKRYLSKLDHDHEVCPIVQTLAQRPKLMNLPITFTEEDARNVHFPNHDPLVIDVKIANKRVSRVLVDDESSINVLFKPAFTAIGLTEVDVASCPTQIYGFNGDSLLLMGKIQLPVMLGNKVQGSFKYFTFIVVDYPTTCNVIFGRPALIDFDAITSIPHLCMKFPCDNGGVGTMRGDQKSTPKVLSRLFPTNLHGPRRVS